MSSIFVDGLAIGEVVESAGLAGVARYVGADTLLSSIGRSRSCGGSRFRGQAWRLERGSSRAGSAVT